MFITIKGNNIQISDKNLRISCITDLVDFEFLQTCILTIQYIKQSVKEFIS